MSRKLNGRKDVGKLILAQDIGKLISPSLTAFALVSGGAICSELEGFLSMQLN